MRQILKLILHPQEAHRAGRSGRGRCGIHRSGAKTQRFARGRVRYAQPPFRARPKHATVGWCRVRVVRGNARAGANRCGFGQDGAACLPTRLTLCSRRLEPCITREMAPRGRGAWVSAQVSLSPSPSLSLSLSLSWFGVWSSGYVYIHVNNLRTLVFFGDV